jgi:hypothetical protein
VTQSNKSWPIRVLVIGILKSDLQNTANTAIMATNLSYNNLNLKYSMYVLMISVLGLSKKRD